MNGCTSIQNGQLIHILENSYAKYLKSNVPKHNKMLPFMFIWTSFFVVIINQMHRQNGSTYFKWDSIYLSTCNRTRPAVSYRVFIRTKSFRWKPRIALAKKHRMFNYNKPHGSELMICYPISGVYSSFESYFMAFCCQVFILRLFILVFFYFLHYYLLLFEYIFFLSFFYVEFIFLNILTVFFFNVDGKTPCMLIITSLFTHFSRYSYPIKIFETHTYQIARKYTLIAVIHSLNFVLSVVRWVLFRHNL